MELKELYLKDYKKVISDAIKLRQDAAFYAVLPKNIVYKGKGEIDANYCKKHNFEVYNSVDFGGGIVGFEGDIVLVLIKQDGWDIGSNFIRELNNLLNKQGINSAVVGNDLLVDGIYKVASHSSTNIGNQVIYTGIQITFNADPEIIKHICMKNSVKVPRGLSYYNVNKDLILDFVKSRVDDMYLTNSQKNDTQKQGGME